ncbi:MAG: DUF4116 domain-containing protein [Bacilli bacterium]
MDDKMIIFLENVKKDKNFLKNNNKEILSIIKENNVFSFKIKQFIDEIFKIDGKLLNYFPEEIKFEHSEYVLMQGTLKNAAENLTNNKKLVLEILEKAPEDIQYVSENLKNDFDIAKLIAKKNKDLLIECSVEMQDMMHIITNSNNQSMFASIPNTVLFLDDERCKKLIKQSVSNVGFVTNDIAKHFKIIFDENLNIRNIVIMVNGRIKNIGLTKTLSNEATFYDNVEDDIIIQEEFVSVFRLIYAYINECNYSQTMKNNLLIQLQNFELATSKSHNLRNLREYEAMKNMASNNRKKVLNENNNKNEKILNKTYEY